MTWIQNFARVRTDDRERKFRDSHVPQPVLQKICDGPGPKTGSFEINRVTPGGPDYPAVKKERKSPQETVDWHEATLSGKPVSASRIEERLKPT